MVYPNALIICISPHHGNTMKIASAMANAIDAELKGPMDVEKSSLSSYDLVGFGSGIYNGSHHKAILGLVEGLEACSNNKAFIFSTASFPFRRMHNSLKSALTAKGFGIVGEFQCRGFMDYSFARYLFGGLNKGRPNENDLEKAAAFAKEMYDGIK